MWYDTMAAGYCVTIGWCLYGVLAFLIEWYKDVFMVGCITRFLFLVILLPMAMLAGPIGLIWL